jgi:lactate dehydrogenase-like 2-hydroxyacid dehydrogenase
MPPIPPSPIKIAILDDYHGIAARYFESLKPAFDITVFQDTLLPYNHSSTPENVKQELINRLKPYTIISAMRERTPFPAELQEQLPNLKLLLSTGLKNRSIDLVAAKRLGITVAGTPGTGRTDSTSPRKIKRGPDSTTQHAVALIIGLARNVALDDKIVKEGGWQTQLATGLGGKAFGTVGLGRLGVSVSKILYSAFGMRIIAWSSTLTQEIADQKAKDAGLPVETDGEKTFLVVGKEELFKQSDFVSVHYVLSERTIGLVGAADLALMKKSAFFINTSRGPLVDEGALLEVLKAGSIKGAAIDVYDLEPLPTDSEWRNTKWGTAGSSQVLLSPHMGYVEEETMNSWYDEQVEIIERWHKGETLPHLLS